MITVKIPKDIRNYKSRYAMGLTKRELISLILGLVFVVPLFVLTTKISNEFIKEIIETLSCVAVALFFICGFVTINGMTFERWLISAIKNVFFFPKRRLYKTKNSYRKELVVPTKKEKEYEEECSYEKLFLLMEAEQRGEFVEMNEIPNENLLTVSKPPKKKPKKEKQKQNNEMKKVESKDEQKLNLYTEKMNEINMKRSANERYILTKQEEKIVRKYNELTYKVRKNQLNNGVKTLKKENEKLKKRKKAKTFIPKTAQDTLPYITDYPNGLFEVEEGVYSKSYILKDLNFTVAKEEEQISVFCKWGEFLNSFSEDVFFSITIDNRIVSDSEVEKNIHYKMQNDEFDVHRQEYNRIMDIAMSKSRKNIRQRKYLTVSFKADSPLEAEKRFQRMHFRLNKQLVNIGSGCKEMTTEERLELLHDKFRKGKEGQFNIDFSFLSDTGLSSKDYVAPSSFSNFDKKNYFQIEDNYYRCMFLTNIPASMSTKFIEEFVDVDFPIMVTTEYIPLETQKALKKISNAKNSLEVEKIKRQKSAAKNHMLEAFIPRRITEGLEENEELIDDIVNKSQKIFNVSLTVMIQGSTLEELNENCEQVSGVARQFTCQLSSFDYQQETAMKITFPMGISPQEKIYVDRGLTTEAAALFLPFTTVELFHKNGYYYGINQISSNMILCDRTKFKSPSGFVLGSSGSGKSFACKREIINVLLHDNLTSVLIIDPEAEYTDFCIAFGGTTITISPTSDNHINPMDMNENYGLDDNDNPETTPMNVKKRKAIIQKSQYLISIIQAMMTNDNEESLMSPVQKSIIDKCVTQVYQEYLNHDFDSAYLPTLRELKNAVDEQRLINGEAGEVADSMEIFTDGTLNVFAQYTNVDYNNRFVVFNIRDLGNSLKQVGLLTIMDFIWNRMLSNFQKNVRTYCYVDEIHILFRNMMSGMYIRDLYKRGRKFGLIITGITQDCEDLLRSPIAQGMISNSDYILMLSQTSENLKLLSDMLHLSEEQQKYVNRAEAGSGLIFAENTVVPFIDEFPSDSYLYKLISTKFGENKNVSEIIDYVNNLIEQQAKRKKYDEEKYLQETTA